MNHRKILSSCFALSLFLHLIALLCFQKYSIWFSSSHKDQPLENWLSHVDKKERDEILKAAFDLADGQKEKESPSTPQIEEVLCRPLQTTPEPKDPEPASLTPFQFAFHFHEPLVASTILPTFSIPTHPFNLLDHLPKELIIPSPSKPSQPMFLPLPGGSSVTVSAKPPLIQAIETSLPLEAYGKIDLEFAGTPEKPKSPGMIPMPNLPKLPTLSELETSSYSDSFDAELIFLPREDGKGYIFALTLIPQPDLNLPKLNQHITFLIDRSNSIQQGRLSAAKSAVHKALEELSPEDTFNIIAFDSKMEKMSPHYLSCQGKSFAIAEEFLEKLQLGSFFSTTDLYKPLLLTVPGQVDPDEIHTAILLTDGEMFAKKPIQKTILHDWTEYNGGRVSLFTLSMTDVHMATFDAISSLNRGKMIHAPTQRGLKRKLLKLMKGIQNPVAKNLSCRAISRSPEAKIELYPKSSQTLPLYLDQPYVILGETDTLDDFILFVQGRLKGRWLNIKKNISFLSARKGNRSLKQEWALQKAYHLYEQYGADENPKHLAEVKLLLEPYDFQTAFQ